MERESEKLEERVVPDGSEGKRSWSEELEDEENVEKVVYWLVDSIGPGLFEGKSTHNK